jgi:hypothetical protein
MGRQLTEYGSSLFLKYFAMFESLMELETSGHGPQQDERLWEHLCKTKGYSVSTDLKSTQGKVVCILCGCSEISPNKFSGHFLSRCKFTAPAVVKIFRRRQESLDEYIQRHRVLYEEMKKRARLIHQRRGKRSCPEESTCCSLNLKRQRVSGHPETDVRDDMKDLDQTLHSLLDLEHLLSSGFSLFTDLTASEQQDVPRVLKSQDQQINEQDSDSFLQCKEQLEDESESNL